MSELSATSKIIMAAILAFFPIIWAVARAPR
jgi:hypothetical protein